MNKNIVLASFLALAVVTLPVAAQEWKPERPVEIVVATGPGGGQDKTARMVQKILQERKIVAVPVSVMNKPGGGGSVAWTYLNQRAKDAHYLEVTNPTNITGQIMGRTAISFAEMTPLAILLSESVAFSVREDSPLRTGRDLIERLKRDAASVSVAVGSSLGSTNHIAIAQVARQAGGDPRKLKTVVFQGGGEAITALLGGHIDVNASAANNVIPHVAGGKVRVLAVAAPQRLSGPLASVPTWRELGIDTVVTNWRLVNGPQGLSPAQIAYWENALAKVVESPEWKADLEQNAFENTFMRSAATNKFLRAQQEEFRSVLTAIGLAK